MRIAPVETGSDDYTTISALGKRLQVRCGGTMRDSILARLFDNRVANRMTDRFPQARPGSGSAYHTVSIIAGIAHVVVDAHPNTTSWSSK